MQFSFSSNAFRKFPLEKTIELVAELGYKGIEIMADIPHAYPPLMNAPEVAAILKVLEEADLKVANLNTFMLHAKGDTWHPSWIEKDPMLREERIDHTLRCIDLAAALGAPCISTEPGGPLEGLDYKEGIALFREGLLRVEERARERKVRILIEPEPGLLIESSTQFLEFISSLDPGVFGLNFDIGHFFCIREKCPELVVSLKEYIHHFHIEDIAHSREHYHLIPGEGAIDFPEIFRSIKRIGYTGFVTVELYTYDEYPVSAAARALGYLQEIEALCCGPK